MSWRRDKDMVDLQRIRGALIDVDGVLHIEGAPVVGAANALDHLRQRNIPYALLTNTTMRTRESLGKLLRSLGFDIPDSMILTAASATADYLRREQPGKRCFLLTSGDLDAEFSDIPRTDGPDAEVVVVGGAGSWLSFEAYNHAYLLLKNGACLVAMHKSIDWMTADGFAVDSGPYVHGLEWATGVTATIIGKPEKPFFDAGYEKLGLPPDQVMMIGDSNLQDVLPAMAFGSVGVLVRTGGFLEQDLDAGQPDLILDGIGDLCDLL